MVAMVLQGGTNSSSLLALFRIGPHHWRLLFSPFQPEGTWCGKKTNYPMIWIWLWRTEMFEWFGKYVLMNKNGVVGWWWSLVLWVFLRMDWMKSYYGICLQCMLDLHGCWFIVYVVLINKILYLLNLLIMETIIFRFSNFGAITSR